MTYRLYFVDTENVGKNGLKGLEDLDADDILFLFHNVEFGKISEYIMNIIQAVTCTVEVIDVGTKKEKNAMDFSIAAKLGMEVLRYGNDKLYYIVSNDKGFECAADFLTNTFKSVTGKVMRIGFVYESFPEREFDYKSRTENVLQSYGKSVTSLCLKCMNKALTLEDYKQALRRALWKETYEKRNDIFEKTKSIYARKNYC